MYHLPPEPKLGEKLICPVCEKEFKATNDTKYICCGGYTCSWKCFLAGPEKSKQQKENKKELAKEEPQKNIIPKPEPEKTQKVDENELFGIIE